MYPSAQREIVEIKWSQRKRAGVVGMILAKESDSVGTGLTIACFFDEIGLFI
jgi:hypothetical protein